MAIDLLSGTVAIASPQRLKQLLQVDSLSRALRCSPFSLRILRHPDLRCKRAVQALGAIFLAGQLCICRGNLANSVDPANTSVNYALAVFSQGFSSPLR